MASRRVKGTAFISAAQKSKILVPSLPTALEVFSAKRCRRSSLAEILGELHWVSPGLRQEYNA